MLGHVAYSLRVCVCVRAPGNVAVCDGMTSRRIAPVIAVQHAHTRGNKDYARRDFLPVNSLT